MKKQYLSLLAIGMLCTGSLFTANATLLVSSSFDTGYTAGSGINGQSGSSDLGLSGTYTYTPSGASGETLNVVSGGLNYSSGTVISNGGANAIELNTTTGTATNVLKRSFTSSITGQDVFASIVVSIPHNGTTGADLWFSLNQTAMNSSNTAYFGINGGKYGAGLGGLYAANSTAMTSVSPAVNDTVLLVAQYVWDAGSGKYTGVNFWLNPTSTTAGAADASLTGYTNGATAFNSFNVDVANLGTSDYKIDSLLVGTTYADVVVPEPSTYALALIGGLAMLMLRSRRAGLFGTC